MQLVLMTTTLLRYGCAALLALTFARASADDRSAEHRRDHLRPLQSWSGVIPSRDDAPADRGSVAPTIEISASTSANDNDMRAGAEQLASWNGAIPELRGEARAAHAAEATDAPWRRQLPSWSGVIPSASGR
jgi:hypothetical protein